MSELFRYVALGDSTAIGVGASTGGGYPERLFRRLKDAGINAGILNLAQSGATTREVVQAQAHAAVTKRPTLITLGIGANDVWRLVPVTTFQMNLKLIADRLQTTGAPVVVNTIVDLSSAPVAAVAGSLIGLSVGVLSRRIQEFNDVIAQLGRRPKFRVVDLFASSTVELPTHPEYFCPDGFHPSEAGYDRWAELLWPAVWDVARTFRPETTPPLA